MPTGHRQPLHGALSWAGGWALPHLMASPEGLSGLLRALGSQLGVLDSLWSLMAGLGECHCLAELPIQVMIWVTPLKKCCSHVFPGGGSAQTELSFGHSLWYLGASPAWQWWGTPAPECPERAAQQH